MLGKNKEVRRLFFSPSREVEKIVKRIQKKGAKKYVIGVSGGKDSTVALSLLVRAVGKDNVLALIMPCESSPDDAVIAKEVIALFGVRYEEYDLTKEYQEKMQCFKEKGYSQQELKAAGVNLKSRLRTVTLYTVAAAETAKTGDLTLVCGTSNLSEWSVGYFTKGADSVSDNPILRGLLKDEVIAVGRSNGVPEKYLVIPPKDGTSGKTDEDNLGYTYAMVAWWYGVKHLRIVNYNPFREGSIKEVIAVFRKINSDYKKTKHKRVA